VTLTLRIRSVQHNRYRSGFLTAYMAYHTVHWWIKVLKMKRKESLPGYSDADSELQIAIFRTTLECRVLLRHMRELRSQVRQANKWGTTANFDLQLKEYLVRGIAGNVQRITRQVNRARGATCDFLTLNSKDSVHVDQGIRKPSHSTKGTVCAEDD
jgi:hypothetical protein